MFILQIALGIVLAVLILRFLPQILALLLALIVIALVLALLGGIGFFIYSNTEKAIEIGGVILALALGLVALASLGALIDLITDLSQAEIKMWDLTYANIIGLLFFSLIGIAGLYFLINSQLGPKVEPLFLIVGSISLVTAAIGVYGTFKDIKKGREQRAIKKSYES